jgi:hypothetical protein
MAGIREISSPHYSLMTILIFIASFASLLSSLELQQSCNSAATVPLNFKSPIFTGELPGIFSQENYRVLLCVVHRRTTIFTGELQGEFGVFGQLALRWFSCRRTTEV